MKRRLINTGSECIIKKVIYLLTLPVKLAVPQQPAPITVAPFLSSQPCYTTEARQTTTLGTMCPTLSDKCVGSFTSHRIINIEGL